MSQQERMSASDYRRIVGLGPGEVKAKKKRGGKREDQSPLFLQAWAMHAPKDLPKPKPQHRFAPPRKWKFDAAFIEQKVAVEVDGGRWMLGGGKHMSEPDAEKMRAAVERGWGCLRFSTDRIKAAPIQCVDEVARFLRGRMSGA